MAHLPRGEKLFPFSDDMSGVDVLFSLAEFENSVDVPLGYLSARVLDFGGCEMPQRVGEQ